MPADDPPSPAELAFLALQRKSREYARWAGSVNAEWLRKKKLARATESMQGAADRRGAIPNEVSGHATKNHAGHLQPKEGK